MTAAQELYCGETPFTCFPLNGLQSYCMPFWETLRNHRLLSNQVKNIFPDQGGLP